MDCFFASVAELSDPVFKGKPLAVCHSNNAQGSAEISSANYEARKYGITAGMFMARGKALCPHLIVLPYDFDKYEVVAEQVRQRAVILGIGLSPSRWPGWVGICARSHSAAVIQV